MQRQCMHVSAVPTWDERWRVSCSIWRKGRRRISSLAGLVALKQRLPLAPFQAALQRRPLKAPSPPPFFLLSLLSTSTFPVRGFLSSWILTVPVWFGLPNRLISRTLSRTVTVSLGHVLLPGFRLVIRLQRYCPSLADLSSSLSSEAGKLR